MNISELLKKALDLEFNTPAGKYNVLFTIIIAMIIFIQLTVNIPLALINAIFFNQKLSPPALWECLLSFGFFGGVCFLYMIFLADKQHKVAQHIEPAQDLNNNNDEVAVESEL